MRTFGVIEDMPDVSAWFKQRLLSVAGPCQVDMLSDKDQALKQLKKVAYDLIVVDVDISHGQPGITRYGGLLILGELKHLKNPPVALVVTALPFSNLREIAMDLDAWDFIQKPLKLDELANEFDSKVRDALTFQDARRNPSKEHNGTPWPNGLSIDVSLKAPVIWHGKNVRLTITQIRILSKIALQSGSIVKYDDLYPLLRSSTSKQALSVHVHSINQAFKVVDTSFDKIVNIPLLGYVWNTNA